MWDEIELREIRVFLALAEELHFARTAQRLGLTQSRVSQSLRGLEHKLGRELLHRTSRRVTLTPYGAQFRTEIAAAHEQLVAVLRDGDRRTLNVGIFEPCSAGPHFIAIVSAFEARYPDCRVRVREIAHGVDPLAAIDRGEVDLLAIRLPLPGKGLTIGPVLTREPRVLAVAVDHRLAGRADVSIEDIADYPVTECAGVPKSIMDAFIPTTTPSGRPIVRIDDSPVPPFELAALVARGKVVHPTVPSFADYFGQPEITYVPIRDLPPLRSALVWRKSNARVAEFVAVAVESLP